jgi:bacteriophage N4 adsorption protein B
VFPSVWPALLGTLAILLLLSGLDDLVPVLIYCYFRLFGKRNGIEQVRPATSRKRRIAIFVPCWREAAVIGNMVRHNLATVKYGNFDMFLGVYPNDEATIQAVKELSRTFRNVHVAICPNPGPTSKADCLNWIYHRMQAFEESTGCERFDTVVLHDAEDVIHPEALDVINRERERHSMVQVPVLPLPTPFSDITHGIYCDEFAEFQTIDMRARQLSRSFIPSNGVGTGFNRAMFDLLATERGQIFDASSLTEDYEIGVHLHRLAFSQVFVPIQRGEKDLIATREYFPRLIGRAIRQRTRWVTGIGLQCWDRIGWTGSMAMRYWLWRDRKGLITNPLSCLTNVLFLAGLLDWLYSTEAHRPWAFAITHHQVLVLCSFTTTLQCFRLSLRMICVARIYSPLFALGVPLRSFHANLINCSASVAAMWRFAVSKLKKRSLVWLKTEHSYPQNSSLQLHRRSLATVLLAFDILSKAEVLEAEARVADDSELAEHLLRTGMISEAALRDALSFQSGIPTASVSLREVKQRVVRTLPSHFQERYGLLPYRVQSGRMLIAGTKTPPARAWQELRNFTKLRVEFYLVTRENFRKLRELV